MRLTDIKLIYEYNYWANEKIITMAAKLSDEQLKQPNSFSWGSLHGTLVHMVDADQVWRSIFEHGVVPTFLEPDDLPDLDAIITHWNAEKAAMLSYLAGLGDEDMNDFVRYRATDDNQMRERVLWHCLYHVVNHSTQHRSECAAMLTDFGFSPGELDFTVFLSQR